MRILEIIPQLQTGGAESFTINLCNEFAEHGHEVILVVTNSLKKYGQLQGNLDKRVRLIGLDKKQGFDILLFFRLTKLISKIKPDVVHTHLGAVVYTILSPILNRSPKYFHTVHNAAEKEATTGGRISVWARKIQFNLHLVTPITISLESQKSFANYYGDKTKSELIWNGVSKIAINKNTATDEMSEGDIKLINVARLQPQKNQLELVKSIDSLNRSDKIDKTVQLYIIGDGDPRIAEEIRDFNSPYTTILGRKDNPRDYVACADAFILSSHYEGLPLTLIECFATGKIPICTPVGGIVDLVRDNENGILTTGTSQDHIIDAICRFVSLTPDEKRAMESASRTSYNSLTMDKCAQHYIELFNKQLDGIKPV
ncbi:MAG: glycosyltransferase [Bacteroides sp.]|nr:glycosyltransferase [Bacteroides sp.]